MAACIELIPIVRICTGPLQCFLYDNVSPLPTVQLMKIPTYLALYRPTQLPCPAALQRYKKRQNGSVMVRIERILRAFAACVAET